MLLSPLLLLLMLLLSLLLLLLMLMLTLLLRLLLLLLTLLLLRLVVRRDAVDVALDLELVVVGQGGVRGGFRDLEVHGSRGRGPV